MKGQFEVVMKEEYADRKKRSKLRDLRARIEQTEEWVSNMKKQLHRDRLELRAALREEA